MNFIYVGFRSGQVVNGAIEAETEREALTRLFAEGITVRNLKLASGGLLNYSFKTRPSGFQMAAMTAQLGFLYGSLGVTRALSVVTEVQESAMLKDALVKVSSTVDRGGSFTEALQPHTSLFGARYVAMVEAGEESGTLEHTLANLADMIESEAELIAELRSALTYPVTVIAFALLVTTFLLTTLVPQFTGILTGLGGELPLPTRIVMGISALLSQYGWAVGLVLVVLGFLFRQYYRTPRGRWQIDLALINLKVIGPLLRASIHARTLRSYADMRESGMNLMEALRIAGDIAGNAPMKAAWLDLITVVQKGDTLSVGMKRHPKIFPTMLVSMAMTGEESGNTEELLRRYASWMGKEAMRGAKALGKLIEPLLIIVLGLLIGFIVLAVMMPYFQIIGQLGKAA